MKDHHPAAELTVLVIDADEHTPAIAEREPFDCVTPSDLGLPRDEFDRMAGIYDVLELSTALKPWLLLKMLEDDEPVIYLDPDIEVFAPIGELVDLARERGIVLTPHTSTPLPVDDFAPTELTILQSGTFNLGFIAVGPQGNDFLDWWGERLRRDCLISKSEGMFVDQRWVDLVPNYFDPCVVREPGWNVAYWNLPARRLSRGRGGYTVNGHPLRFFHFSGFNPDRPERLSYYQGDRPRIRLEDEPVLAELCRRYADELILSGHRAYSRIPYPYDRTASGLRLDQRARRLYRRELMRAERGKGIMPPDPFDRDDPDAFVRWLNESAGPQELTRYLRAFYEERQDVQAAFPDIEDVDARLFVDWVRKTGAAHEGFPQPLVPRPAHPVTPDGVNVAGYHAAENGVGEAARRIVDAFDAADVPTAVVTYRNTRSRQGHTVTDHRGAPLYGFSVIAVNADQLSAFAGSESELFDEDRYAIGAWAWEVERLPAWMAASTDPFDEIWVYSEHSARAIRHCTTKPVFVAPPPVVTPRTRSMSRSQLGLPEGFCVLFCFDFDSVFERKNPIGVVEAFRRAFPTPAGPQLVIKSVRGEAHPEELARLRGAAAGRPDIHVVDGYRDPGEQAALMASCDAYVSLHRAEGFGLTMAEAMALGKPVIATAYSGNLEFMDDTNSWLVPYELVAVPAGCDPYPTDARWAQPDLEAAAAALRQVVAEPDVARERGARAAADIARLHSPQARAPFLVARLETISASRTVRALGDDGHPWSAVESAEHYLEAGPDLGSPARYGFISRIARRFAWRFVRHFAEHQDRLHNSLVDSVRELQGRLAAETAAVRKLEAKIAELQDAMGTTPHAERIDKRVRELPSRPSSGEEQTTIRPLRERGG